MLKAILSFLAALFGWFTKAGRTPGEKEIQQIRKERDEEHKTIDDFIDGVRGVARVPDTKDGQPPPK